MFKSTILKLREEESNQSIVNGTFQTNLSHSVTINEGDQIQIKSAFLDTTTEDSVTVEVGFTAKLHTCRYLTNYYDSTDATLENPFRTTGANANCEFAIGNGLPAPAPPIIASTVGPDLKKYWACQSFANQSTNRLLVSVEIVPNSNSDHYGSKKRKDKQFQFIIQYRNPTVASADATYIDSAPISVPRTSFAKNPTLLIQVGIWTNVAPGTDEKDNVRIKPFTGSEVDNWNKFGMNKPVFTDDNFDNTAQTEPFVELIEDVCEIPIPEGIYTPTELSSLITDQMSLLSRPGSDNLGIGYAAGNFLVDSPFLSSMYQEYFKALKIPGGTTLPPAAEGNPTILYMGEDNYGLFSNYLRVLTPAKDNLLGANNASLAFDESLSKLDFDVLHFPVQVDSLGVNTPGIVYNPEDSAQPTDFPHGPVLSYAGSGITRFEPSSFWNQLGFGPDNTISGIHGGGKFNYTPGFFIDPSTSAKTALTGPVLPAPGKRTVHDFNISSTDGVNTTAQYAAMDLIVTSIAAAVNTPGTWMNPFINTAGLASSVTTPIIGDRQFSGSTVNDGFYMINIGVNLPQDMISSNKEGVTGSNRLQSIVGKFFTQGNFLQDEGSGSITYTHVGPPQLLSTLDVQILNGDGSNPSNTDIGNNSTIFLEVVKPVPPRPIAPNPSATDSNQTK